MTACPNTTTGGCRCPEHHPGLLDFSRHATVLATAIASTPDLRLVDPPRRVVCHGYPNACNCPRCTERAANGGEIPQIPTAPQPWEPRPARRAA